MNVQLYLLAMVLTGSALAGTTLLTEQKYEVACRIELTNGGGTQTLTAKSGAFTPEKFGAETQALAHVGPYTLQSEIQMRGPDAFRMQPTLTMNVFEGDPIRKSLFNTAMAGFVVSRLREPLSVGGSQFRTFTHDGVQYTRLDSTCSVQPTP